MPRPFFSPTWKQNEIPISFVANWGEEAERGLYQICPSLAPKNKESTQRHDNDIVQFKKVLENVFKTTSPPV